MAKDFVGQRFGRLEVLKERIDLKKPGSYHRVVECLCDCGNIKICFLNNLKQDLTHSCGCLHKEIKTIHGHYLDSEYRIWKGMLDRCYNKDNASYHHYGGRGIGVSDEWKDSFETFFADMGPRPSLEHSIDRRDNDKGYSKENCRWATDIEQANNKSTNVFYTYKGETRTLSDWCRIFNLDYKNIRQRIYKGMLFEVAISLGKMSKNDVLTFDGVSKTIFEWCSAIGVSSLCFKRRIYQGWTIEEALSPIAGKQITYNAWNDAKPAETMSLREWCELLEMDIDAVSLRILRGESFEDIVKE